MSGKYIALLIGGVVLSLPVLVGAEGFQPLVGIPGLTDGDGGMDSYSSYVNALYAIAIGIAGLLAVIKLIFAGTKYMLSDIVTDKQSAKKDIKWALVGLIVVLGAVVILTTINTDLTNADIAIEEVNITPGDGGFGGALNERIEALTSATAQCNEDPDCRIFTCDALGNFTYAAVGAGAIAGGAAGSVVPIVGTTIGAVVGGIGGAYVAYQGNDISCDVRCNSWNGTRIPGPSLLPNTGSCLVPDYETQVAEASMTYEEFSEQALDEEVDNLIEEGEFTEVLIDYTAEFNSIPIADRPDWLLEKAEECEENPDGSLTGNRFEEISFIDTENLSEGVRHVCVR